MCPSSSAARLMSCHIRHGHSQFCWLDLDVANNTNHPRARMVDIVWNVQINHPRGRVFKDWKTPPELERRAACAAKASLREQKLQADVDAEQLGSAGGVASARDTARASRGVWGPVAVLRSARRVEERLLGEDRARAERELDLRLRAAGCGRGDAGGR